MDTLTGIVDVILSNTTPSDNSLSDGSRVKGKVRLSSEQTYIPLTKSIRPPRESSSGSPITQWSETSLLRAKEINKESRSLTKY